MKFPSLPSSASSSASSALLVCGQEPDILTVPDRPLLYCPFSYRDIAMELDEFFAKTFPTENDILSEPVNTQESYSRVFAYVIPVIPEIQRLVTDNPYQGFQNIFTLVRTDGIVIADIVGPTIDRDCGDLEAVMVQTRSSPYVLDNIQTIRYDAPTDPDVPSTILNGQVYPNLKVYSNIPKIDEFEPFTTRLEFIQAGLRPYGYTSRPGIYVRGQLYCVARLLTFRSGIQIFRRLSYLRTPPVV